MASDPEDEDGYDDYDGYLDWEDDEACECDGSGIIVTCIDDICRGLGECIHGDGERLCPCGNWM